MADEELLEGDDPQPWKHLDGEPTYWYERFIDYMNLGPKRSLRQTIAKHNLSNPGVPYAGTSGQWKNASDTWRWKERADAYDVWILNKKQQEIDEERQKVLTSDFSQIHKRVEALNKIAMNLYRQIENGERDWSTQTKTVGVGKSSTVITEEVFNHRIHDEFRAYLNDIALELGERNKNDTSSKEQTVNVHLVLPTEDDDQQQGGHDAADS